MNEINFKWRKSNLQFFTVCLWELLWYNFITVSDRTVINFGSRSEFLTNYVSGSVLQVKKLRFLRFRFRFHNTAVYLSHQHQPTCSTSTLNPRYLFSDNYVCTIILYVPLSVCARCFPLGDPLLFPYFYFHFLAADSYPCLRPLVAEFSMSDASCANNNGGPEQKNKQKTTKKLKTKWTFQLLANEHFFRTAPFLPRLTSGHFANLFVTSPLEKYLQWTFMWPFFLPQTNFFFLYKTFRELLIHPSTVCEHFRLIRGSFFLFQVYILHTVIPSLIANNFLQSIYQDIPPSL